MPDASFPVDPFSLASLTQVDGWNLSVEQVMRQRTLSRPQAVRLLCEGVLTMKGPGGTTLKGSRPAILSARVLHKVSATATFVPMFKDLSSVFREESFPMDRPRGVLPTLGAVWLAAWVHHNDPACAALDRLNPAWPDDLLDLAGTPQQGPGRLVNEAIAVMKEVAPHSDPWGLRAPLARCMGQLISLWEWKNWENRVERMNALHVAVRAGCVIGPPDEGGSHPLMRFWMEAKTHQAKFLRAVDTLAFVPEVSLSPDSIMRELTYWLREGATLPEDDMLVELRQEGLATHHPEVFAALRTASAGQLASSDRPSRSRQRP